MSRLTKLTLISMALSSLIFFWKREPSTVPFGDGLVVKKEWLKINDKPITPASDVRPADQTFLTFPEWFLVFSPQEQADYYNKKTSTSFPFMSHVSQMWKSYRIINKQIKEDFPVNTGYHFMIWVIAGSTTVEYGAKALYENLIGRLTDTKDVVTDEDKFNAQFANDYVTFIKDRPWYEFDFKSQLKKLWSLPKTGSNMFRKWERRYCLTSELLVKWGYGKLIGVGTRSVYGAALPTTVVLVDGVPANFPSENVFQIFDDQSALIKLPRYDKFNDAVAEIAKQGIGFREIAGNNSAILVSVITPADQNLNYEHVQTIFVQPITSDRSKKRLALVTPVPNLHNLLLQLGKDGVTIEHVFDY
jgi:hypothetical protein